MASARPSALRGVGSGDTRVPWPRHGRPSPSMNTYKGVAVDDALANVTCLYAAPWTRSILSPAPRASSALGAMCWQAHRSNSAAAPNNGVAGGNDAAAASARRAPVNRRRCIAGGEGEVIGMLDRLPDRSLASFAATRT